MASNITTLALESAMVGWQPMCNSRGTWDIIWTCVQTMVLCAWVSVCVNVPAPDGGPMDRYTDKFFFVLLSLLGPELIFLLAFGQYHTANTSKRLFQELGHLDWSITHSFYADMGGIHVQPKGWKRFPVNAKQLHYLVRNGYMQYPDIKKWEIEARSKVDGLARFVHHHIYLYKPVTYKARLITGIQTLRFLVAITARFITGLAVTTLEMTVLANVFCTIMTFVAWWHKPTDVEISHLFELPTSIEKILKDAGDCADGQYRDTPLDFVSRDEWSASLLWNYYVNILRRMNLLRIFRLRYDRPAQHMSTFNWPKPATRLQLVFILGVAVAHCAFFLGAWTFHFPTPIERTLWRSVAVIQAGISLTAAAFEIILFRSPIEHTRRQSPTLEGVNICSSAHTGLKKIGCTLVRDLWSMPCNNELTGHFPCLDVPLRSILVTTPCCALYVVCRWYIIFEDLVALRSSPSSAYQHVNWTPYLPWL